ncbi:cysteine hydrolase family protein [Halopenitus persicus]|uniref:cysteine hydrolase family protein n=1 Tax=Halopenitus persicus TaxID=1048396 RepID=UPI000BBA7531|nr:isochorismatase family cysteine hydrolase [Halopenitus persicus]
MRFDPTKTALVVVDMQNGFAKPDGCLYDASSNNAIDNISELIELMREANAEIIFTRDIHPPEQFKQSYSYDESTRWGDYIVENSWDANIVDEFEIHDDDHIVDKYTYDAFNETGLEAFLSTHGLTDLIFCGTQASICVLHTARSAALLDFRSVIVSDAVGYRSTKWRDFALEHFSLAFGETITRESVAFTQQ